MQHAVVIGDSIGDRFEGVTWPLVTGPRGVIYTIGFNGDVAFLVVDGKRRSGPHRDVSNIDIAPSPDDSDVAIVVDDGTRIVRGDGVLGPFECVRALQWRRCGLCFADGSRVHVGDRIIDVGAPVTALRVDDDGRFAYATSGRVAVHGGPDWDAGGHPVGLVIGSGHVAWAALRKDAVRVLLDGRLVLERPAEEIGALVLSTSGRSVACRLRDHEGQRVALDSRVSDAFLAVSQPVFTHEDEIAYAAVVDGRLVKKTLPRR